MLKRCFKLAMTFFTIISLSSILCIGCKTNNGNSQDENGEKESFAITFEAGNGGSISATVEGSSTVHTKSPINVQKGKIVTFTAKNASGYVINQWNITGGKFENGTGRKGDTIARLKVVSTSSTRVSFTTPPRVNHIQLISV